MKNMCTESSLWILLWPEISTNLRLSTYLTFTHHNSHSPSCQTSKTLCGCQSAEARIEPSTNKFPQAIHWYYDPTGNERATNEQTQGTSDRRSPRRSNQTTSD